MSYLYRTYSTGAMPATWKRIRENSLPGQGSLRAEAPSSLPIPSAQLIRWKLERTCRDVQKYRRFLAYTGNDAQRILDSIQYVLNAPSLRDSCDFIILKAMTRLAGKAELLPRCFQISNLQHWKRTAAQGSFGLIWKAVLDGEAVCVKILRQCTQDDPHLIFKNLLREGLMWGHLSHHPNVVPFYGIYVGEEGFGLVSPWMENGNVMNYLKRNHGVSRLHLIYDIGCGIRHLHGFNVVHGDVKGLNVLVNSSGRACLADFGLTNIFDENILRWPSVASTMREGTSRWRAPELIFKEMATGRIPPNTPSSDVYSWACTAYEILTGRVPFFEIESSRYLDVRKATKPDFFPSRPSQDKANPQLSNGLWELLENCWSSDAARRPNICEVLRRLEGLMDSPESAGNTMNSSHTTLRHGGLAHSRVPVQFSCGAENAFISDEDLRQVISMIPI